MAKNSGITKEAATDEAKEAELEDLVDRLGADPSKTVDKADVVPDVVPDVEPGPLFDQNEAGNLPTNEDPGPSEHLPAGGEHASLDAPKDHTDVDPSDLGLDQTDVVTEVDELIGNLDGAGGLDGRNDAVDGGGGKPGSGVDDGDPLTNPEVETSGFGNPHAGAGFGDGSAAGALPQHQQAVLNNYKNEVDAALDAGDSEKVDELNKQTENFLKEIGQFPEEKEDGELTHSTGPSLGAAGGGDTKFAVNKKTGEVEEIPIEQKTDGATMGSEASQMKATGTAASSPQGKPASGGKETTQDQGEEYGLGAPDKHKEFTDRFFETKTEAEAGGAIDPNPNEDSGATSTAEVPTDTDAFTAEFEEGYVPIDESVAEDRAAAFDITPDEEFLDT